MEPDGGTHMRNAIFAVFLMSLCGCAGGMMKKPPQTQEEYCKENPGAPVCAYSKIPNGTSSNKSR